jgi:hypothetical protein
MFEEKQGGGGRDKGMWRESKGVNYVKSSKVVLNNKDPLLFSCLLINSARTFVLRLELDSSARRLDITASV